MLGLFNPLFLVSLMLVLLGFWENSSHIEMDTCFYEDSLGFEL